MRAGRGDPEFPLCPRTLHLMRAVSSCSPVTQDDPKRHSPGKHRNESPQPLTGMVKVSESLGCGKPLLPSPSRCGLGSLVDAGIWAVSRNPGTQVGARKSFGREGVNHGDQEWWPPTGVGIWVTCLCGLADLGGSRPLVESVRPSEVIPDLAGEPPTLAPASGPLVLSSLCALALSVPQRWAEDWFAYSSVPA